MPLMGSYMSLFYLVGNNQLDIFRLYINRLGLHRFAGRSMGVEFPNGLPHLCRSGTLNCYRDFHNYASLFALGLVKPREGVEVSSRKARASPPAARSSVVVVFSTGWIKAGIFASLRAFSAFAR